MEGTNNIPAFPMDYRKSDKYGSEYNEGQEGMSLRDYFAAQSLPIQNNTLRADIVARRAYEIADEMMKQREL